MQVVEIKVPDIGDFADVTVIELLVKPGDAISVEQSLLTVESDKASMEIPSNAAGILQKLLIQLGDKVSEGTPIAILQVQQVAKPAAEAATPRRGNLRGLAPPCAAAFRCCPGRWRPGRRRGHWRP
ncbi:MAG: dihydrolipoyl dehydrogenase, partial [Betaproteobacteria bacterium]|nr:dihydrolipoyl dehydrogenase [Betaproteobacteria bacterium]